MKISKLVNKVVVDVNTANKLGKIKDAEIDIETGKIISFDVVLNNGVSSIFKNKNKVIATWDDIENIGDEVILLNIKNRNN